jgi:hypothetical protein
MVTWKCAAGVRLNTTPGAGVGVAGVGVAGVGVAGVGVAGVGVAGVGVAGVGVAGVGVAGVGVAGVGVAGVGVAGVGVAGVGVAGVGVGVTVSDLHMICRVTIRDPSSVVAVATRSPWVGCCAGASEFSQFFGPSKRAVNFA